MPHATLAVVADIGGTNTRVALAHGTKVDTGSIRRYRNAESDGIEPILRAYLAETGARPQAACVDMAGPVRDGVGTLTNLPWRVAAAGLREATGATTVSVLNDMQAQGVAVGHLDGAGLATLIEAPAAGPGTPRLVVNMGTGLNAQPVLKRRGLTLVPPAEAGHVSIPVQTQEELRLRDWVAEHHTHTTPGLEDLLSGRGFERVHSWCCAEEGESVALPASEIFAAFQAGEARAVRAARIVVRLLGRYAGDLALITLPVGGIYLVGGVIRHLGPHLNGLGFVDAFRDKGRFAPFMEQFAVHVVADDYAALTGCAVHLDELLREPR
ncbi:glucokinase [Citreimonas salinaria]|uniref:Glucokinase n=1 Tax=Citreimonas salinaria TaxID=321339 RepID=A0A1H3IIP5_9RHOB|nr:glucokinase [Citreimonas salinaria]SDY27570.1 glucokinase [Citreimonas salinaria]